MKPAETSDQMATRRVLEGWDHLKLQRPVAAWAAFQRAMVIDPESRAAARAVETLERAADLPAAARVAYRFRAIAGATSPPILDLDQAADHYGRLAAQNPSDPNLWYNRALCLAWTGVNREAITCLERVVELEAGVNPESASAAWLLAEVLRQGAGAETLADDLQYSLTIPWRDDQTQRLSSEFPEIEPAPIPSPGVADDERPDLAVFSWFDAPGSPGASPQVRELLANVYAGRGLLRLSSPRLDHLEQAEERLVDRVELGTAAKREARPLPLAFLDAGVWTFRVPLDLEPELAQTLHRARIERYFEDEWLHAPRRGLAGDSPLKAATGDQAARARLAAVVRFREQLAERPAALGLYQGYPFDRLRRRLGLELVDPGAVDAEDLTCASPAELDALDSATLDLARLTEAVLSAAGLRDDLRTIRLAAALLDRSLRAPEPERPRGLAVASFVAPLVRDAMRRHDADGALRTIEQARPLARPSDLRALDIWSAEVMARSGRPEDALKRYLDLIQDDESSAVAALEGARDLLENGHEAEAHELSSLAARLARERNRPWLESAARRLQARLLS